MESTENENSAPNALLVDSLLLALIRGSGHKPKKSDFARLKGVTRDIFGREPVLDKKACDQKKRIEQRAVEYMVFRIHQQSVLAGQDPSVHGPLSIRQAAKEAQERYFPTVTHAHSYQKRLQEIYSGSDLNKRPSNAAKVKASSFKRGLEYRTLVDDRIEENMVYQKLCEIEQILKPWGTRLKFRIDEG